MKVLIDAIQAKFNADVTLKAALTGDLWGVEASPDVSYPYGTFFIVSGRPDDTFSEYDEDLLLQFSLFSKTSDNTEVCNLYTYLTACFDWCTLTVTGYTSVYMKREISRLIKDEDVWHYSVDYRIYLEKD